MGLNITSIATLITEISVLATAILGFVAWLKRLTEGLKCQLRSEMLRIYYANHESGKIRQYEYENFVMLYKAYKALKGNSFVDKIYSEIQALEIIP